MDTGTTLIGIGFILLMVLPFVAYYLVQKVKARRFVRHFFHSSASHNLSLDQNDTWRRNYAIGIDSGANQLFYLNKGKTPEQEAVIDLSKVAKCRVSNGIKSVKTDNGTKDFTDILGLAFTFSDPGKDEVILEFYDGSELMSHPDGELEIAERWLATVNSCIKSKTK